MDESATLRPDERLRRRAQFLRVYRSGQRIHSRSLVLYLLPREEGPSRLGLTVSRRIGKAVVRNRIKRRLREIFRVRKHDLDSPCDLVVNTRRIAADTSFRQLDQEFKSALDRWKRRGRQG